MNHTEIFSANYWTLKCTFRQQWLKFRWGGRGGGQPPPTIRKSAQFVGNFRLCRNFQNNWIYLNWWENYWRVRQIINTERRFDYFETISLICVNHFSHFCACSYLLKNLKNYGKSKQIFRKFAKVRMLTMINNIIFVCLFDCNWLRTVMIIYNISIANVRAVELGFRKSIGLIISFCDDSSTKYEAVLTKIA